AEVAPALGNYIAVPRNIEGLLWTGIVSLNAGDTLKHFAFQQNAGTSTQAVGASSYFDVVPLSDYSAGDVVGFGFASETDYGLVKGGKIPGDQSNTAISSGMIGE